MKHSSYEFFVYKIGFLLLIKLFLDTFLFKFRYICKRANKDFLFCFFENLFKLQTSNKKKFLNETLWILFKLFELYRFGPIQSYGEKMILSIFIDSSPLSNYVCVDTFLQSKNPQILNVMNHNKVCCKLLKMSVLFIHFFHWWSKLGSGMMGSFKC